MEARDWQRIKEVFALAKNRPGPERAACLRAACGGEAALREQVESLLAAHDEAEHLIERSDYGVASIFNRGGAGYEGRRLGHYNIIREIGRGGMGTVYLCERADDYRQRAAVKVVRRGMDSEDTLRRFRNERQILASLDHENIARLLDGGTTDDGLPYLVMEYVEGEPVNDYCDGRRLTTSERLRLFRTVCAAVHHAHQSLVVHRDLKPSNILITPDGRPKLLDFGIAKLLDPELSALPLERTVTEQRLLTPDYASPEQLRGENLTTASDVYSLGVVLYGLLTGHRPYRSGGKPAHEFARSVGEEEPTKPSAAVSRVEVVGRGGDGPDDAITPEAVSGARGTQPDKLRRRLAGDLDNIVLMAMRKEPGRRYASAAQFAEDIRRHLEGLPVVARQDTFGYRATKFVRRNRIGVAAAGLVLVSLVGGIVSTAWQAARATAQARLAAQERDRAERRFGDVRQLSNALLTDIAPKIERLPGSTEARQAVLTQSLTYLDRLAGESADDPALQSELASAYEKIGELQGNPTNPNLVALSAALASYEKANEMRRGLLERNPADAEQRRLLANNYRALGDIRWQTGEPAESLKNSETALRLYTELLARQPDSTELRLAFARTLHDLGVSHTSNEKFAESIALYRKAIEVAEELRRLSPERVDVLSLLANCRRRLGNSLSWEGRQEEGEAEAEQAVAIFESLVAAHPDDAPLRTSLYLTYMMTSSVYEETDDPVSNEYAFKALKLVEQAVASDAANLRAKQQLATNYSRLGVTLENVGRVADSVLYLEKAVRIWGELARGETKNRKFRHDLATARIRLGDARYQQRNFAGALEDLGEAAAILEELADTDAGDNASRRNLANACDSLAKTHEALAARAGGAQRESHRRAAGQNVRRAVDLLLALEARRALSQYDRKSLEKLQADARKYE